MHRLRIAIALIVLILTVRTPAKGLLADTLSSGNSITPGEPIDYTTLAFFPERWREQKVDTTMYSWEGTDVILLTNTTDLDTHVMTGLVGKLDRGWQHYAKLTGSQPRRNKHIAGKPVLAAVPNASLTCGYGCGYVGGTGIELSAFYQTDYDQISRDASNVPDYYFYEMGRNFYTFGHRHSLFTTGYAVFMRYVCVDELELKTGDATRMTIEQAEAIYADSDLPFLSTFTNYDGLSEKKHRLKNAAGQTIAPTDQPVMYASAMLKLRAELGGDKWLKAFFRHLKRCDPIEPKDKQTALHQSLNWYVAASCAAGKDLSPIFVDRWRMPLTPAMKEAAKKVRWKRRRIKASQVVAKLIELE